MGNKLCCNCKNLCTHLESVGPGQCIIVHTYKITNDKVQYNSICNLPSQYIKK